MIESNQNIFEEFKTLTTKDILLFFTDTLDFFRSDYNTIVQYYSGKVDSVGSNVFQRFENLDKEKEEMFIAFQSHSRQMRDTRWWDLLGQLEEIDNRFATLKKVYKWTRSSATNFSYSPNIQLDYMLGQNESLERVTKNVIGSTDSQNDWVTLALENQLEEEDYTIQGGTSLKVTLSNKISTGIQVQSVVDTLNGKSIYGKDLQKELEFSSDDSEGDLVVLDYDDTIFQSVEILTVLKKNDNPDAPNLGLQTGVAVGSNRALLNFPVITRQLSETFASDDTLKEFQVLEMRVENDNLLVDFQVKTRLNETQTDTISL